MSQPWADKGGRGWHYWHGAWSPRATAPPDQQQPPWHRKPNKQQDKHLQGQALFPAYDAKRPAPKANMQQQPDLLTVVSTSSTKDQSLVRDMQKVLNAARKAEQKVARTKEDKATKVRMWEEWEVQLKQQYLAESKRHQANIESLDRDLEAALKAQDMARAEVRRAADPESSQDVQMMAPSSEMEVAFARLLDDARSDSWAQLENEEVLKRAMQASRLSGPSTPPTSTPLPRTPYGRVLAPRPKQQGAPPVMGSRLQPFPPPRGAELRYPAADLNRWILTNNLHRENAVAMGRLERAWSMR